MYKTKTHIYTNTDTHYTHTFTEYTILKCLTWVTSHLSSSTEETFSKVKLFQTHTHNRNKQIQNNFIIGLYSYKKRIYTILWKWHIGTCPSDPVSFFLQNISTFTKEIGKTKFTQKIACVPIFQICNWICSYFLEWKKKDRMMSDTNTRYTWWCAHFNMAFVVFIFFCQQFYMHDYNAITENWTKTNKTTKIIMDS